MLAKLMASIDLLPDQIGLFRREVARVRLASYGVREAVVGTVTRLWILRTSATWFTALDRAFRQGATAHGLGIGKLRDQLANLGRDIGRGRGGHALSYGYISRKITNKKSGDPQESHSAGVHPAMVSALLC
jgi:hypothetical protein